MGISGVLITHTGWTIIDPIMSLIIAAAILVSTWHLLTQSLRLSLDGTPEDVDFKAVEMAMQNVPHVLRIYHIHIWAMSTIENAITAHVVIDNLQAMEQTKVACSTFYKSITSPTLRWNLRWKNRHNAPRNRPASVAS